DPRTALALEKNPSPILAFEPDMLRTSCGAVCCAPHYQIKTIFIRLPVGSRTFTFSADSVPSDRDFPSRCADPAWPPPPTVASIKALSPRGIQVAIIADASIPTPVVATVEVTQRRYSYIVASWDGTAGPGVSVIRMAIGSHSVKGWMRQKR